MKDRAYWEIHTVRLWGHFEGDAQAYRGAELETLDERDPIPAYAATIGLSDAQVADIKAEADAEVDAAVQFALDSPVPTADDEQLHVFA